MKVSSHGVNSNQIRTGLTVIAVSILVAACGGGGSGSPTQIKTDMSLSTSPTSSVSGRFKPIDDAFNSFLNESPIFDGISFILVNATQTLHTGVYGDHTENLVVMLASTSKVPAVMTILAVAEDPSVNFSMSKPINTMLPFKGLYGDRTVEQLVSNTSGIPGLRLVSSGGYGTTDDLNHLCQYSFQESIDFEACGETLLSNELPTTREAGAVFDYGGSQWQLAGVTTSIAANSTWNQLVHKYFSEPCELEVFAFGNPWEDLAFWNGSPDSLRGAHNPNIEGGAISNLRDYAKLLQVHLNGGFCGKTQVLSQDAIANMQTDRGSKVEGDPTPYGMGWWIGLPQFSDDDIFHDPGAFGAVSFIDKNRGIGGFIAIDDYTQRDPTAVQSLLADILMPLIQSIVDQ